MYVLICTHYFQVELSPLLVIIWRGLLFMLSTSFYLFSASLFVFSTSLFVFSTYFIYFLCVFSTSGFQLFIHLFIYVFYLLIYVFCLFIYVFYLLICFLPLFIHVFYLYLCFLPLFMFLPLIMFSIFIFVSYLSVWYQCTLSTSGKGSHSVSIWFCLVSVIHPALAKVLIWSPPGCLLDASIPPSCPGQASKLSSLPSSLFDISGLRKV